MKGSAGSVEELKEIAEEVAAPSKESEDPFYEMEKRFESQKSEYTFVLKTKKQRFPKGSQIYLTYGKMPNRETLLHYGFVLEKNKYDYTYFEMSFSDHDKDPRKLQLVKEIFKCGSVRNQLVRNFRIYYQSFNECKSRHKD